MEILKSDNLIERLDPTTMSVVGVVYFGSTYKVQVERL